MWQVTFAENKNENQACKKQSNYLNVYRLQNYFFISLFPILRTFSLHNSDQPLRNARNDLFTCRPLFSFYLWASVHSSCYAQIFLKSSALKSPNLASILCAVNRAQNEIYCDLLCYKSSASCTFHRVLHSIILSFRVLRMKTSIEMCNKGRSCQLTYARQCLVFFMNIFIVKISFDLSS